MKAYFLKLADIQSYIHVTPNLHEEVYWMLEALNAMGLLVWSPNGNRKYVAFHVIKYLAYLMKSLFNHKLTNILSLYAKNIGIDVTEAMNSLENGKLPSNFVKSMFYTVIILNCVISSISKCIDQIS